MMKLNKLVVVLGFGFVSGVAMANDGSQTTLYVPNIADAGYELNAAQSSREEQTRDGNDAVAVTWGELPVSTSDLGGAIDGQDKFKIDFDTGIVSTEMSGLAVGSYKYNSIAIANEGTQFAGQVLTKILNITVIDEGGSGSLLGYIPVDTNASHQLTDLTTGEHDLYVGYLDVSSVTAGTSLGVTVDAYNVASTTMFSGDLEYKLIGVTDNGEDINKYLTIDSNGEVTTTGAAIADEVFVGTQVYSLQVFIKDAVGTGATIGSLPIFIKDNAVDQSEFEKAYEIGGVTQGGVAPDAEVGTATGIDLEVVAKS
ncbi:hypothetical protein [Cysteiniphilum sp. QT6929]|uniref:hypothetical protein n=1 Tax=Cysteiniphilum sp. QT6929 TaxID=2975055 RepID=UPI0024B361F2|nr:hypothetical protein [Cysteiniphilum sp. QT6929]WHN66264.1 hypothetical protein NYP54_03270 [Cysteiniphilum sp. QT6929]